MFAFGRRTARPQAAGTCRYHLPFNVADETVSRLVESFWEKLMAGLGSGGRRWQEREESGIGYVLSFSSTWGPEAEPPQSNKTLESRPQQFRQDSFHTTSVAVLGVGIGRAIEDRTMGRASGDRVREHREAMV